jgi:polysaccharide biosynthesis/export protein
MFHKCKYIIQLSLRSDYLNFCRIMKRLFYFYVLITLLSGCTQYKDITYLRNAGIPANDSIFKNSVAAYKIQPSDLIYISVSCLDENINKLFVSNPQTSSMISSMAGNYLIGYLVDVDGNINLPVIGRLQVSGLTMKETKDLIQKNSEKFITDPRIEIRLLSFRISVLGEVKRPGQFTIYNDKANVIEALAMAGDITYYGNRHKVLLMRATKDGTVAYRIDVTNMNLLTSPYFYMQPNDIIYVEPMRNAGFRLSAADYAVLISTITATLTTIFLIRNF